MRFYYFAINAIADILIFGFLFMVVKMLVQVGAI